MIPDKRASTDYPVHELIAARWSPYTFQDRPVPDADLRSLFEAARWAASSFNEQPWTYIVATKEHPDQFQRLLSCLFEFNQGWAKAAPVLALGVVTLKSARDGRDNPAAFHDLGLAAGNLLVEATARGIDVHQMMGIFPDKAREIFTIPAGYEARTALAIGYRGDPTQFPEALQQREQRPRQRKPLSQFVFSDTWGNPSPLVRQPSDR
jgi:nitroreductase